MAAFGCKNKKKWVTCVVGKGKELFKRLLMYEITGKNIRYGLTFESKAKGCLSGEG